MPLTCSFTGHRPQKFPWRYNEEDAGCQKLQAALEDAILSLIQRGYTTFLSGMAEGTDTWAALIVLKLKAAYPEVKLHCILPCKTQASRWSYPAQLRYHSILAQADSVQCLRQEYHRDCMLDRNRYLVDHSDLVLAVYNGEPRGGTACTVRYAQQLGREILLIDPDSL